MTKEIGTEYQYMLAAFKNTRTCPKNVIPHLLAQRCQQPKEKESVSCEISQTETHKVGIKNCGFSHLVITSTPYTTFRFTNPPPPIPVERLT